jgi:hypothetical protein
MFAFLYRDNPRDIIKDHYFESEINIIRNLFRFMDEEIKIKRFNVIDGDDKIRRLEAVLKRGTILNLLKMLALTIRNRRDRICFRTDVDFV